MTEYNKITNIGVYNIKKPIVDNRNNVHTLPSRIRYHQAYRNAILHTSEPHSPRRGIPERIIFRTEPKEEAIGRYDKSNVFVVWYLYQSF